MDNLTTICIVFITMYCLLTYFIFLSASYLPLLFNIARYVCFATIANLLANKAKYVYAITSY